MSSEGQNTEHDDTTGNVDTTGVPEVDQTDPATGDDTQEQAEPGADDDPDGTGDDVGDDPDGGDTNREGQLRQQSARYRRRLRETEAERDQLRTQLTAMQQASVDDIVTRAGYAPKLLASAGTTLADVLNDDGTVDTAEVTRVIQEAAVELNVARRGSPLAANPQQGTGGTGSQRPVKGFADAFAPRRA